MIRGGREDEIESRQLVSGDVVLLESGARVPADLRLVSATALRIDESLLTGESLPLTKKTGTLALADCPLADRTLPSQRSNSRLRVGDFAVELE